MDEKYKSSNPQASALGWNVPHAQSHLLLSSAWGTWHWKPSTAGSFSQCLW